MDLMQKIGDFFRKKKWQRMKKSDWAAVALTGVLLLILAMPTERKDTEKTEESAQSMQQEATYDRMESEEETYTRCLEERLEAVLGEMEGVGRVKVMITLSDYGERVVEKDTTDVTSTIEETDSNGGSRTTTERENGETTVYVETGEETYPYIGKEILPSVKGVVIVAEGGGNPAVVSDISDAVMALFPVEAHRIKVVRMSVKET